MKSQDIGSLSSIQFLDWMNSAQSTDPSPSGLLLGVPDELEQYKIGFEYDLNEEPEHHLQETDQVEDLFESQEIAFINAYSDSLFTSNQAMSESGDFCNSSKATLFQSSKDEASKEGNEDLPCLESPSVDSQESTKLMRDPKLTEKECRIHDSDLNSSEEEKEVADGDQSDSEDDEEAKTTLEESHTKENKDVCCSHHNMSPNLGSQIHRAIENHDFELYDTNEETATKRGRPEEEKDNSDEKLEKEVKKWLTQLNSKVNINQRSDAKTASTLRHIKKLPDYFLKYLGSKCQYKSKCISTVLRSYLKAFINGFAKYYNIPNSDLKRIFLDHIILCFPEAKIRKIFELLKAQDFLSTAEYSKLVTQVEIRNKASKANLRKLYHMNKSYRLICEIVNRETEVLKPKAKKNINAILKGFGKK